MVLHQMLLMAAQLIAVLVVFALVLTGLLGLSELKTPGFVLVLLVPAQLSRVVLV